MRKLHIPVLEGILRRNCVRLNARGRRSETALHHTERVFRALARFYPDHPTGSLGLNDLAKRTRLTEQEALQAACFLTRSPAHLGHRCTRVDCTDHLDLGTRGEIDESLRHVPAACAAIVDGVAHLRNRLTDAHGNNQRSAKPGRHHAEFIVLIAAATTGLSSRVLTPKRPSRAQQPAPPCMTTDRLQRRV